MQEITITLRIDFDTANKKSKEPLMLELAKQSAKELITNAMLICDRRKPQIALQCGDHFSTTDDINLFEASSDAANFG